MHIRKLCLIALIGVFGPAVAYADGAVKPSVQKEMPDVSKGGGGAVAPLTSFGRELARRGIFVKAIVNDEVAANLSGGQKRGSSNTGIGLLGADIDLDRLGGIPDAKIHVLFAAPYGDSIHNKYIGNAIKVQGSYFDQQKFQLAQLTYEQGLFGNRLNILVGRTNATGEFAMPTYGCLFVNGSQCPNYTALRVGQFSGYPYVTWGGRLRYSLDKKVNVKAGLYEIDPTRKHDQGFNFGRESTVTGYTIPFQFTYGTSFKNDQYPRHFTIGGWYNSADYIDPLLTTTGKSRALFPGAPKKYHGGRGGFFMLGDQVVYRPDRSRRNLAVFATLTAPLDTKEFLRGEAAAGFVYTGPFVSRPADKLGVQATYLLFTDKETQYQNDLLTRAGSNSHVDESEWMLEANYSYQVSPGMKLIPSLQYIINPDITGLSGATEAPNNAFVAALRVSFNLGGLLGWPHAPR